MPTKKAISWVAVSTKAQADDEKNSLPVQERNNQNAADEYGWQVIDTLRVPGHSRRYIDIHECARDMLAAGIDAFSRLLQHWKDADFDILIVRDGSRFARTQSLHAYIVERTISIGARIYSLADGWVDETNYRMWISMAGYAAAGEVDNLAKRREMGFRARMARGLPTNHQSPMSHVLIRDPKSGKALRLETDESKRGEIDDMVRLLLEGVPFTHLALEMHKRFGYSNPLGEPYHYGHYKRLLYSPVFWGNTARGYKHKGRGEWLYREGAPVPDGVEVWYGTVAPFYTGEKAARIQAELERRWKIGRGRAKPKGTKMFTGLLICGECSYNFVYANSKGWAAYRCNTATTDVYRSRGKKCSARKHMSEKKVKAYVTERLTLMLEHQSLDSFLPSEDIHDSSTGSRTSSLEKEIADMQKQIRRAILDKSSTDDEMLRGIYDEEITKLSTRLKLKQEQYQTLQEEEARQSDPNRQRALLEVQAIGIGDGFWEQSSTRINQILHLIMGKKRFVVVEGKIAGVADAPQRPNPRYSGL